ncbi:ATP-dependent DNA helicase MER3-like [Hondaea fermentalgiana]|uniref:ATP-dependent DNA helicase MER3-like n=1 Tax=Hondaea fermentalgiana TaxID=2315210 RepID=A0A2R5G6E3_9STRA|nr:ATP-dependent DNA helicase MER3-like [Hondaea fermentalgiana]|eukprot:GBG26627.1 ATP-dependent DNA helicase MER3-like [Hondaea fermentalgiana]
MQAACRPVALDDDISFVVSAPTSSGKTLVLAMAMLRCCKVQRRKTAYLAPTRALCRQQVEAWNNRYGQHGIKCIEITSGKKVHERILADANVIFFTPEKLEHLTRKWFNHKVLFESLGLVLLDEVHLVSEGRRGAVLETLISRLQFVKGRLPQSGILRFAAVSGTIPNASDLARWLGAPIPRGLLVFGPEFRPCPLVTHVEAFGSSRQNEYLLEREMDQHVGRLLARFAEQKASLVFCTSRKSAKRLAERLSEIRRDRIPLRADQVAERSARARAISGDPALELCIERAGVAWHTGEVSANDQEIVERLFRDGLLSVLVATSTLAQGMNLPAHLVVIKGTQAYRGTNRGMEDLTMSSILQMVGRAGRFGMDSSGCAVIMVRRGEEHKFERILSGAERVKSALESSLREVLLHEIHLGAIRSFVEAYAWLETTFFFCERGTSTQAKARLKAVVATHLKAMRASQCIRLLPDRTLCVSELGAWICESSLCLATGLAFYDGLGTFLDVFLGDAPPLDSSEMQRSFEMDSDEITRFIVDLISRAEEFSHLILRRDQKRWLNEVGWNQGRFRGQKHVDRVSTVQEKVFQLLQAAMASERPQPPDKVLRDELDFVVGEGARLARSLITCATELYNSVVAASVQLVLRSLETRAWPHDGELLQLPFVGPKLLTKLRQLGIESLRDLVRIGRAMPETFRTELGRTRAAKIMSGAERLAQSQCSFVVTLQNGKHFVRLAAGQVSVAGFQVYVASHVKLLAHGYIHAGSRPLSFVAPPQTSLALFAVHPKVNVIVVGIANATHKSKLQCTQCAKPTRHKQICFACCAGLSGASVARDHKRATKGKVNIQGENVVCRVIASQKVFAERDRSTIGANKMVFADLASSARRHKLEGSESLIEKDTKVTVDGSAAPVEERSEPIEVGNPKSSVLKTQSSLLKDEEAKVHSAKVYAYNAKAIVKGAKREMAPLERQLKAARARPVSVAKITSFDPSSTTRSESTRASARAGAGAGAGAAASPDTASVVAVHADQSALAPAFEDGAPAADFDDVFFN